MTYAYGQLDTLTPNLSPPVLLNELWKFSGRSIQHKWIHEKPWQIFHICFICKCKWHEVGK